jgi:hypothetical protein
VSKRKTRISYQEVTSRHSQQPDVQTIPFPAGRSISQKNPVYETICHMRFMYFDFFKITLGSFLK